MPPRQTPNIDLDRLTASELDSELSWTRIGHIEDFIREHLDRYIDISNDRQRQAGLDRRWEALRVFTRVNMRRKCFYSRSGNVIVYDDTRSGDVWTIVLNVYASLYPAVYAGTVRSLLAEYVASFGYFELAEVLLTLDRRGSYRARLERIGTPIPAFAVDGWGAVRNFSGYHNAVQDFVRFITIGHELGHFLEESLVEVGLRTAPARGGNQKCAPGSEAETRQDEVAVELFQEYRSVGGYPASECVELAGASISILFALHAAMLALDRIVQDECEGVSEAIEQTHARAGAMINAVNRMSGPFALGVRIEGFDAIWDVVRALVDELLEEPASHQDTWRDAECIMIRSRYLSRLDRLYREVGKIPAAEEVRRCAWCELKGAPCTYCRQPDIGRSFPTRPRNRPVWSS